MTVLLHELVPITRDRRVLGGHREELAHLAADAGSPVLVAAWSLMGVDVVRDARGGRPRQKKSKILAIACPGGRSAAPVRGAAEIRPTTPP